VASPQAEARTRISSPAAKRTTLGRRIAVAFIDGFRDWNTLTKSLRQ
jgi:hypothetical protein